MEIVRIWHFHRGLQSGIFPVIVLAISLVAILELLESGSSGSVLVAAALGSFWSVNSQRVIDNNELLRLAPRLRRRVLGPVSILAILPLLICLFFQYTSSLVLLFYLAFLLFYFFENRTLWLGKIHTLLLFIPFVLVAIYLKDVVINPLVWNVSALLTIFASIAQIFTQKKWNEFWYQKQGKMLGGGKVKVSQSFLFPVKTNNLPLLIPGYSLKSCLTVFLVGNVLPLGFLFLVDMPLAFWNPIFTMPMIVLLLTESILERREHLLWYQLRPGFGTQKNLLVAALKRTVITILGWSLICFITGILIGLAFESESSYLTQWPLHLVTFFTLVICYFGLFFSTVSVGYRNSVTSILISLSGLAIAILSMVLIANLYFRDNFVAEGWVVLLAIGGALLGIGIKRSAAMWILIGKS